MKRDIALGFIETVGLASAIAAADAALKAANVRLIGRENTKGQGCITIKIAGEVSAVQAGIAAAKAAGAVVSSAVSTVIPRPGFGLRDVMVDNVETVLDEFDKKPAEIPPSPPAPAEPVTEEPEPPHEAHQEADQESAVLTDAPGEPENPLEPGDAPKGEHSKNHRRKKR